MTAKYKRHGKKFLPYLQKSGGFSGKSRIYTDNEGYILKGKLVKVSSTTYIVDKGNDKDLEAQTKEIQIFFVNPSQILEIQH